MTQPVGAADAGAALRAAAGIGPYFAVDLDGDGPAWLELAELLENRAALREEVSTVGSVLAERTGLAPGAIDGRAVASLHALALAARLVAPSFAAAVVAATVPVLTPDLVRWQRSAGGPVPMALVRPKALVPPAGDPRILAAGLNDAVIATVVAPLVAAFAGEFRLSGKVLWGNVASALGGAATMLVRAAPGHSDRALAVAAALLADGLLLSGHGRYVRPWPDRPERFFVRDSCCLFYRIPGGGTCGDCVLVSDEARRVMWRDQAGTDSGTG